MSLASFNGDSIDSISECCAEALGFARLPLLEPLEPFLAHLLEEWFLTFLMMRLLNTVPHAVGTPNHKVVSWLLHNCKFNVMNCYINILHAGYLMCSPHKGITTYRLRATVLGKGPKDKGPGPGLGMPWCPLSVSQGHRTLGQTGTISACLGSTVTWFLSPETEPEASGTEVTQGCSNGQGFLPLRAHPVSGPSLY